MNECSICIEPFSKQNTKKSNANIAILLHVKYAWKMVT